MTGTRCIDITDPARKETLGDPAKDRRIAVRFYYPAAEGTEGERCGLLTERERSICGKDADFTLFERRVQAFEDLQVREGRFPLILFSHSYGGFAEQNSDLCCFLAEHGYIVASVSHPYEACETVFGDGTSVLMDKSLNMKSEPILPTLLLMFRKLTPEKALLRFDAFKKKYGQFSAERLEEWLKDDGCVIRKVREMAEQEDSFLFDRIDFSHGIGALGHSFGGAAAYLHCLRDAEISCGANLDGGLFGEQGETVNHKPFMQIINRLNFNVVPRCFFYHDRPVHFLVFRDMRHMGFTDLKLVTKNRLLVGKAEPEAALDTMNEALTAFFDRYLRQGDAGNGEKLPIRTEALERYDVL